MRNRFASLLLEEAKNNSGIFLLCGDLGFSVLEPFAAAIPDRFINAGISEQNMSGMAAGLALSGKKVFTYSIANFAVLRCLEQIRNDICYHNADVTVVSVGGGLPYGNQGYTHIGAEDMASMRSLPNMTIYNPADRPELEYCLSIILKKGGPAYLRMARGGEKDIHKTSLNASSSLIEIASAQDITLLASGVVLSEAVEAAQMLLQSHNIRTGVYSAPVLDSALRQQIIDLARRCSVLITVEEHHIMGGFGSMVAEIIAEHAPGTKLYRKGIEHSGLKEIGSHAFLRWKNGIDAAGIKEFILQLSQR